MVLLGTLVACARPSKFEMLARCFCTPYPRSGTSLLSQSGKMDEMDAHGCMSVEPKAVRARKRKSVATVEVSTISDEDSVDDAVAS